MNLARDLYHVGMALYYTARLAADQKAVTNTYRYNHHLERTSIFRRAARRWVEAHPAALQQLTRRTLFVDHEPDAVALGTMPEGSLGRAYAGVVAGYEDGTLDVLRRLRLATLPHEARGLDLTAPSGDGESPERSAWLTARRNLYMTTSHDFAHLLTGCDVTPEGEAIVAMYQYHHLAVPQNFLNMWNARLFLSATLQRTKILRIRAARRPIEAGPNPIEVDWSARCERPLTDVRVELGLPPEGLQTCPMEALAH